MRAKCEGLTMGLLLMAVVALVLAGPAVSAGEMDTFGWDEPGRILINMASPKEIKAPMAITSDPKAAKGKYLGAPEGPNHKEKSKGGFAVYEFGVKVEGRYKFWGRKNWCCGCGNSLTIQFDGKKRVTFGEDGTYDSWQWLLYDKKTFKLKKGKHTLKITNREDGSKIDQVLLLLKEDDEDDEGYVPVGIEE